MLELEERIHGAFLLPSDSFAARAEESENEMHAAGAIDDSSPTNVRALSQLDVVKNEIPAEEDMTAKIKKGECNPVVLTLMMTFPATLHYCAESTSLSS